MNTSELILLLQRHRFEHGDLPVCLLSEGGGDVAMELDSAEVLDPKIPISDEYSRPEEGPDEKYLLLHLT